MQNMKDIVDNPNYPSTLFKSSEAVNRSLDNLLAMIRGNANKGLHIGAGGNNIPGLINCDLYNPEADVKADATNLGMFEDGSIDLIETHHMIEHLSFSDSDKALKEWRRVLKDRGLLVITCPDITRVLFRWFKYTIFYPVLPRPERLEYIVKMIVGSQENDGMFHRNVFDARRMGRILTEHGFNIEFSYAPYPLRPTPSFLTIARKI